MTNQETARAMKSHHAQMAKELNDLVLAISTSEASWESARNAVASYLREQVLPHAAAEESTVYRVGAKEESLKALIDSMLFEHTIIKGVAERIASSNGRDESLVLAAEAAKLFEVHAEKENRFIIDFLEPRNDVDLGAVLGDMHQLLAH